MEAYFELFPILALLFLVAAIFFWVKVFQLGNKYVDKKYHKDSDHQHHVT